MNHLAHLHLSRMDEELLVGNFIADAVKGKKYNLYQPGIAKGILMHRFIDSFTDRHELVHESKKFFSTSYGLFSSVIIDVVFDHMLAVNWNRFSIVPLEQFANMAYQVFEKYLHLMPERNQQLFPFMQKENWLLNYSHLDGLKRTFQGMGRRIANSRELEHAWKPMLENFEPIEKNFLLYYPQLELAAGEFILNLQS
jgi:acyl carrier protein phosphodiesterase